MRKNLCQWGVAIGILLVAAPGHAQSPGQPFKSPLKNFTIPIPFFVFGTKVEKEHGKDDGVVLFWGKAGEMQRIDYFRIPKDHPVPADSSERYAYFHRLFDSFLEAHPNIVLAERGETLDGVQMLHALVNFTGGSRLTASQNGGEASPMDSIRGLLVFARGDFVYILQDDVGAPVFNSGGEVPSTETLGNRANESLPKLYRSISFL